MKSQYRIGAAKAEIIIPDAMFPLGFGRGMKFVGQHDPLYVRALVLENDEARVLLVTMDLDSLGHIDMWKDKIRQVLDVAPENIYVMATHNHTSIHIRNDKDDAPEGDADTATSEALTWTAMAQAIRDAERRLQPGRVAFGTGLCDININREWKYNGGYLIGRNPHGPSDKTVAVFRFETMDGKPLAFFINYAVHGSVMAELEASVPLMICGDIPGYTSRYVEEHYGDDVVALWTSGAAGNQDAKYRAVRIQPDENGKPYYANSGEHSYILVEIQARDLAEEVIRVSETMGPGCAAGELASCQTACTVPQKAHGRGPGGPGKPGGPHGPGGPGGPGMMPMGPRPVEPEEDPASPHDLDALTGEDVTVQVGLLNIDGIALSCYSGEETYELGQMAKAALREKFRDAVVVAHCNGYIGYMADITGFERRVRSALVSLVARGYAEKIVVSTPMELAKGMGR